MAAWMRRNTHRTPQHTTDNHSATHRPILPTQLDNNTDSDSDFEATALPLPQRQQATTQPPSSTQTPPAHTTPTTPSVRPIQVGEWVRKVITRRILDSDKTATTKKLLQPSQWGIGVTGGAEAIAITHLLIEDLWRTNQLTRPYTSTKRVASVNWNTAASTRPFVKITPPWLPSHYGSTPTSPTSHKAQPVARTRPGEPNKATWRDHSRHLQPSHNNHETPEHSYTTLKRKGLSHGYLPTHPSPNQTPQPGKHYGSRWLTTEHNGYKRHHNNDETSCSNATQKTLTTPSIQTAASSTYG